MKAVWIAAGACLLAGGSPARAQQTQPPTGWRVQSYQLSPAKPQASIDLALPSLEEDITIYAKRRAKALKDRESEPSLSLGSVALTGTDHAQMAGFRGLTVTAGVPIKAVPGLEATLNLSGGHDTSNTAADPTAAAVTAGFRLSF